MKHFVLPEGFAIADPGVLQAFLAENATLPVRIEAVHLRRLDTRLVELLLCAAKAWRANDLGFELAGLTPAQEATLTQLGISSDVLTRSVAA